MGIKVKNTTLSLPLEILERFRDYTKEHYIPSISAGVKEALEEYAKKIERERLYKKMIEASKDPLFMKDLEDSMKAFEASDREITKAMAEW
ncbi:MAG: hypothetical protein AB1630_02425 [bacterium]